jgi:hypothetical protein
VLGEFGREDVRRRKERGMNACVEGTPSGVGMPAYGWDEYG